MGYTHYWTIKKPVTKEVMVKLATDMQKIEQHFLENEVVADIAGDVVKLADGGGQGDRVDYGNDDKICFNGTEENDNYHETFIVAVGDTGFEFCKTNRKPYDLAVCLMLLAMEHHLKGGVDISSDGDKNDWGQAFDLYTKIFPRRKPQVKV